MNKYTLIPRPETELIVEEAIQEIRKLENSQIDTILIDIGTGTGCIPIAIMKSLKPLGFPNIEAFASDISRRVLRIAKINAKTHNTPITFLKGNLLTPVTKYYKRKLRTPNMSDRQVDYTIVITANLPYLTEKQHTTEKSIMREPRSALIAEKNGLALYEQLLQQIHSQLFSSPIIGFFEIDPSQAEPIKRLIKTYLPTATVEIKPDLANRDRVVKISLQSHS